MTEREIERLAELVAIKVNEQYLKIVDQMIKNAVVLHVAQCAAGKYAWLKSLCSAIVGGVVVGVILWFVL